MKVSFEPNNNNDVETVKENYTINTSTETSKQNTIEPDIEKINNLKNDYDSEIEQQPKKKRGRRPKTLTEKVNINDEAKINEAKKSFASGISFSVNTMLSILIERMPNPKPLTSDEKKLLNDAVIPVSEKYFSSLSKYGLEVNLLLVLGLTIYPRILPIKKEKEKEKVNIDNELNNLSKQSII